VVIFTVHCYISVTFWRRFIGVWLTLEWVQFALGRLSLLKTVLNRRFLPLCALAIASAVTSVFWETVNSAHHFWSYTNWPLPKWQLMHIPLTVLLTWPLQYGVFLSLGFLVGRDIWRAEEPLLAFRSKTTRPASQ
jgi:hypothetical protein